MPQSRLIDLRSDTVTKPTDEMREAAAAAKVGDDVYDEDPTVKELEKYAADLLGMEAALFVTSGTQGNLISILSQASPGDEVLLEDNSHIYYYEAGGVSAIGGIFPRIFSSEKGYLSADGWEGLIRSPDVHFPNTKIFCIENTHNRHGGIALTVDQVEVMASIAHKNQLKVHLDGARIFNATTHYSTDVKNYTKHVDSISVCLSKGLSAPIGSIVAGTEEFIEIAKRKRKLLGGGMRQVGMIAAPAYIALRDMRERLVLDHIHARQLAEGLTELGVTVWPSHTNIVMCDVSGLMQTATEAVSRLKERNILASDYGGSIVRLTTHRHIDDADIDYTLEEISKVWLQ